MPCRRQLELHRDVGAIAVDQPEDPLVRLLGGEARDEVAGGDDALVDQRAVALM